MLSKKEKVLKKFYTRKSRRWGVRPVLRQRKTIGEYKTTFLLYKDLDPEWFFAYTRMTSTQFDECLNYVGPLLQKNSLREPISPSQRLAMTLRFLSQGDSLFSIASGYKIGRSTASVIIRETTEAIWTALRDIVFKPWTANELKHSATNFLDRWDFPHTVSAIDGKHIAITKPYNSGSNFFCYKEHFSIILLAACDAYYNFTYVDIGAYGSQSDGGVLSNSSLGEILRQGKIPFPLDDVLPQSNIKMPYFFVADDAFALSPHLMKPYKGRNLNTKQMIFNYRLSRARRVIENAFGILVSRWRLFMRTLSATPDIVDSIVKATVCLHNYLKQKEFAMPDNKRRYCPNAFCDRETDNGIIPGDWRVDVGDQFNVAFQDVAATGRGGHNPGAKALQQRDKLAQYVTSPAGAIPGQINYVNRGKINY